MELIESQTAHHRAFNAYLHCIRKLLKQYSIRELCKRFNIDMAHARLASETPMIYADTLNPWCINELRHLSPQEQMHWTKKLIAKQYTPTQLRKELRTKKKSTVKYVGNSMLKAAWLVKRELNKYNEVERQKIINIITI